MTKEALKNGMKVQDKMWGNVKDLGGVFGLADIFIHFARSLII